MSLLPETALVETTGFYPVKRKPPTSGFAESRRKWGGAGNLTRLRRNDFGAVTRVRGLDEDEMSFGVPDVDGQSIGTPDIGGRAPSTFVAGPNPTRNQLKPPDNRVGENRPAPAPDNSRRTAALLATGSVLLLIGYFVLKG